VVNINGHWICHRDSSVSRLGFLWNRILYHGSTKKDRPPPTGAERRAGKIPFPLWADSDLPNKSLNCTENDAHPVLDGGKPAWTGGQSTLDAGSFSASSPLISICRNAVVFQGWQHSALIPSRWGPHSLFQ